MQKSSHRFGNAYVCMQYIYIYRSPPRPLLLDGRGLSRARVRFTMHYRFAAHLTRRVCAFKRDDHLGREASPCPPDALSPGLGADLAHGTRLASAAQVRMPSAFVPSGEFCSACLWLREHRLAVRWLTCGPLRLVGYSSRPRRACARVHPCGYLELFAR